MEGDYIDEDGIHHVRTQVEFNGTEEWAQSSAWGTDTYSYYIPFSKLSVRPKNWGDGKCNYMTKHSGTTATQLNNEFIIGSTAIIFNNANVTGLTNFKNWVASLTSNPLTLEYENNEEILETFTEAQATKFEEIKSLTGYNNITIVDVTSNDLTPNVSLKYYAKGWI